MSEEPLDPEDQLISAGSSPAAAFDEPEQAPPQPVKRKGGRKPVYATVEERKQRNRQAQAAFRERRTEYIKQLELTMKENEELMENLQQSNREATEECHMLRYKTSLLEDLLYENGIDFQSELQMRSTKSLLASPYSPQGTGHTQWPAQNVSEAQANNRSMPHQSAQKLKLKGRATAGGQTGAWPRPHSVHILPSPGPRGGGLSMPLDTAGMSQPGFNHSNGAVTSVQSVLHRQSLPFEDMHVDPSMGHSQTAPYFSPDAQHMAHFIDPEQPADGNAYGDQPDPQPRRRSSHSRRAQSISMRPQDRLSALGQRGQRRPSSQDLYGPNPFGQGLRVESAAMQRAELQFDSDTVG